MIHRVKKVSGTLTLMMCGKLVVTEATSVEHTVIPKRVTCPACVKQQN